MTDNVHVVTVGNAVVPVDDAVAGRHVEHDDDGFRGVSDACLVRMPTRSAHDVPCQSPRGDSHSSVMLLVSEVFMLFFCSSIVFHLFRIKGRKRKGKVGSTFVLICTSRKARQIQIAQRSIVDYRYATGFFV